MITAVYGGSFNPPHLGHRAAAETVSRLLKPDRFLIIPDNVPPHKEMAADSPTAEQRAELCRLNFQGIDAEISLMELEREGRSYTAHTIEELRRSSPEDELILVIGTDMLMSFEKWYRFRYLLESCTLAVISREGENTDSLKIKAQELRERYSARVRVLEHVPLPMASSDIRQELKCRRGNDKLSDSVYACILKNSYYGVLPNLDWLRKDSRRYLKPKRYAHVAGCEAEARKLALRWGEDPNTAAQAGILHDITKSLSFDEQLILCEKYGIILDNNERESPALLHARTGAPFARELYGISDEIFGAIRWHTTGRPDMTLLEKIVYLADIIEPGRDFPGVDKLRRLSYENINKAMAAALEGSMAEVRSQGRIPHENSAEALKWYTANS